MAIIERGKSEDSMNILAHERRHSTKSKIRISDLSINSEFRTVDDE